MKKPLPFSPFLFVYSNLKFLPGPIFSCQMHFVIFFFLYLAKFSIASIQPDEKNEVLSFLTQLSQEKLAIYEQEKENITFLFQEALIFKKNSTVKDENYQKLKRELRNLLRELGINDLLKAMMQDNPDSDYIPVIFWSFYPQITGDITYILENSTSHFSWGLSLCKRNI